MGWLAVASAALVAAVTTTSLAQDAENGAAPPPGNIDVFNTAPEEYNRVTVPVMLISRRGRGPVANSIPLTSKAKTLN